MKIRLYTILFLCVSSLTISAQLNTDRITAIGRNALYFEDYVLSIQYFNQVIKIKPYLAEPYMYRAIAKIQLGDYLGAELDCTEAIERNPFLSGAYYTRGFVYRQQKYLEKAEVDFTAALQFAPENKTYMLLRADVLEQLERYDDALADMDFLLKKEPTSAILHLEKGTIALAKKDTATALSCFNNVVKYDPHNPISWSARGCLQMASGNDAAAQNDLSRAISLGSKWSGDYINRGVLYYKQHNYRGALADYDKAVEYDPKNAQCYYNRGLLRNEVGDYNNALADFNKAIELEPANIETFYQRGVVNLQLRNWKEAVSDFEKLIARYPYFLPGYYLAAQANESIGNKKTAFAQRQKAFELEKDKEKIRNEQLSINTDAKTAQNQAAPKDRRKEFSNRAAQNLSEPNETPEYDSELRGNVQKHYANVINEPNFALTYYAKPNELRRTSYFHLIIENYNNQHLLGTNLKITYQEIALTAELINKHFENINRLSEQIDFNANADLYFARAMEFALVQDFNSAIDDLNKAIAQRPDFAIAYFCRANWRYKLLEYISNAQDQSAMSDTHNETAKKTRLTKKNQLTAEKRYQFDFELIMRDYDYVIKLVPDFSFAWYNKANILCTQKDFKSAISNYKQAIAADPDFAEAHFNCGLTQIFIDDVEKGIESLSKAGELGIYQAYNLITRFQ